MLSTRHDTELKGQRESAVKTQWRRSEDPDVSSRSSTVQDVSLRWAAPQQRSIYELKINGLWFSVADEANTRDTQTHEATVEHSQQRSGSLAQGQEPLRSQSLSYKVNSETFTDTVTKKI